jgi:hypothetical protein
VTERRVKNETAIRPMEKFCLIIYIFYLVLAKTVAVAPKKSYGIARGEAVDIIIGVHKCEIDDELEALVKYKNGNHEFVPSSIVAELAPKGLIQFYESRLHFS